MSRVANCSVCSLAPKVREKVDEALTRREPLRELAEDVGVSKSALDRHRKHIPAQLAEAAKAADVAAADTSLGKLVGIEADLKRVMADAHRAKDRRMVIAAARELIRVAELLAKIRGELNEKAAVQIAFINDPSWLGVVSQLLSTLERFPDARAAVVQLLGEPAPPRELSA